MHSHTAKRCLFPGTFNSAPIILYINGALTSHLVSSITDLQAPRGHGPYRTASPLFPRCLTQYLIPLVVEQKEKTLHSLISTHYHIGCLVYLFTLSFLTASLQGRFYCHRFTDKEMKAHLFALKLNLNLLIESTL